MDGKGKHPQPAARSILQHRRLGKPGDRWWLRPIRGNSRPQWSELRFQFNATRGRWVSDRDDDAYAHAESNNFTETASNSATETLVSSIKDCCEKATNLRIRRRQRFETNNIDAG